MKITNFATVPVDTTAGGTEILSIAAAKAATTDGMEAVIIEPSVDIMLVDAGGATPLSTIPGAVAGTAANSAARCPANVGTTVMHRGGPLRAISSAGTSTVKVTLVGTP